MADDRGQDTHARLATSRRRLLATAALAPILTGVAGPAHARTRGARNAPMPPTAKPVTTGLADWAEVGAALGAPGDMKKYMYHTGLPRQDLEVISQGVRIDPALALGTHVAFVRYTDGSSLLMGDAVVTEDELQPFSDALHEHGIRQTAIHKHLLAQQPDIWWTHLHAHGTDPVAVARGLRAAIDRTGTPIPETATASAEAGSLDLDTAGIDAALGVKGSVDGRIYKSTFARSETITDGHLVLPQALGSTTSINFQPLGGGRAALSGDVVMIADEVQDVLMALRRGGVDLVEVHHHNLSDEPRLFFVHYWAVGDAVQLAQCLRRAVDATDVVPLAGVTG